MTSIIGRGEVSDFEEYDKGQKDNIRHAGDYKIKAIKLYPWNGADPIDLTNVRGPLNIFEDIFNNFVCGSLVVMDTWDLPMLYPLLGEEILKIVFLRPGTKKSPGGRPVYPEQPQELKEGKEWSLKFRVLKMTDRQFNRDKTQTYTLHFISPEYILNKKKKVQKTYNNWLYSDIVKNIYAEHLDRGKPFFVEPTMFEQDFAVSNWTPAQAINIIASRSLPDGRVGSSHLFFEDLEGFHFKSLEELYEQPPHPKPLVYQWHNILVDGINQRIDEDIRNVEAYDYVEYFNVSENLIEGMYGSRLMTYDLVRHIFKKYDYDYLEEFGRTVHLEKNPICSPELDALGAPKARFDLLGTNKDHDKIPWIAGKEPGIKPTKIEETVQQRHSLLQQLNNVRIAITIPGDSDRKVGGVVRFAMPNGMSETEQYGREPERYLSGKYLIAAMRHRFEIDGYFQDIEIIKDSFWKEIKYIDPVPIYMESG